MKYKKNRLKLNEIASVMQDFYFLAKFDLVLIYLLKVYYKKYSSILLRKNMFNSLVAFFLEKHVPSQVFKDFSVENLKTTPSISLSKFRVRSIYLELLIIGVVFLHYT